MDWILSGENTLLRDVAPGVFAERSTFSKHTSKKTILIISTIHNLSLCYFFYDLLHKCSFCFCNDTSCVIVEERLNPSVVLTAAGCAAGYNVVDQVGELT